MQGPSNQESDGPIASINIIPLVDVVLVLLIIFMVTTVFTRESKTDLKLPEGYRKMQDQQGPVEINVTVAKDGSVTVNGKPTALNQVPAAIAGFRSESRKTVLVLRGDERAIYGKIMPVLDKVSGTGVTITLALIPGKRE